MKNLLETMVQREYDRLLPTVKGFCGCPLCRDDVLVYALNRVPPRYVTQPEGEVLTHVRMETDQPIADISMALLDGFRKVQASPRKGHEKKR